MTYEVKLECGICRNASLYDIPVGTHWLIHMENVVCETCGCGKHDPSYPLEAAGIPAWSILPGSLTPEVVHVG